ncbi:hypothetical protein RRG08_021169 [Elysia crispata]|uniref:Uncharacterized protein n=1 Tax=Elysia crispata TaxID=231223 RepID=A0AAE1DAB7_9GAST|nr:hypothetical protein RRG08_021169 [Elysia crispata]
MSRLSSRTGFKLTIRDDHGNYTDNVVCKTFSYNGFLKLSAGIQGNENRLIQISKGQLLSKDDLTSTIRSDIDGNLSS